MRTDNPKNIVRNNYGFIKGRIAEAFVERLLITLGMEVYPSGFEVQAPRLATLKRTGKN